MYSIRPGEPVGAPDRDEDIEKHLVVQAFNETHSTGERTRVIFPPRIVKICLRTLRYTGSCAFTLNEAERPKCKEERSMNSVQFQLVGAHSLNIDPNEIPSHLHLLYTLQT